MVRERYFLYRDNHFTLKKLLEKPEILSYLRRHSVEKNRKALRTRLYNGLYNDSITKEVVTGYMQGGLESSLKTKKVYPCGDNHFTLKELLEKPEILSYLRGNGVEKNRRILEGRLYNGLRSGRITEEVVTGYMQGSLEVIYYTEMKKPSQEKKEPPPRLDLPGPLTCIRGLTEEISDGIYGMEG